MFPRINPRISSTTVFLTFLDYVLATLVIALAVVMAVSGTYDIWHGCVYVFHHWWFICTLPVYWLALVGWLLLVLLACFLISIACIVYYQAWEWTKTIFGTELAC